MEQYIFVSLLPVAKSSGAAAAAAAACRLGVSHLSILDDHVMITKMHSIEKIPDLA